MSKLTRLGRAASIATLFGSLLWGTTAGCSSSKASSSSDTLDSGVVCPTSLEIATDSNARCSEERYVCPVSYPCGQFLAGQALCTCTGGKWACTIDGHEI